MSGQPTAAHLAAQTAREAFAGQVLLAVAGQPHTCSATCLDDTNTCRGQRALAASMEKINADRRALDARVATPPGGTT